mgnify:CR=1 FL=1
MLRPKHASPAITMSTEPSASSSSPEPTAAKAPLQSVDFLRSLLESTPDAIYFKDRESRFMMISRSMARLLGLADPQEAYGKCDHDFFSVEHADQARADECRIMETAEPVIALVEKETWPDGHTTWASTSKLPLRDAAGHVVGTFGISRDVTARKVAEQRLQEAQRSLAGPSRHEAAAQQAAAIFTQALGLLENVRIKTERIRRRATRTSADAMGHLAGRLTTQLANGTAEHQLAVELSALTSNAATEQKALLEDLDELHRNLNQLTSILTLPQP